MKHWHGSHFFMMLLIFSFGIGIIGGCDSGEKVLDEVTGRRAVKQYQKSKKDLERIEDQQAERYESIPDEDEKKDDEQR